MQEEILTWHVGDVIAKWRRHLNMSRLEMAKRAGLHPHTVASLEKGKGYRSENLQKVADVLGMTTLALHSQVPQDTHLETSHTQDDRNTVNTRRAS
tara:strand:+ start:176 stop:463 length:288 start_codon:yes stop_codon:yes gene_type:complete